MKKKIFLSSLLMLVSMGVMFAQAGATGIEAAATELKSYITPVKTLMWAIGGVVGLVGAVRVYIKWNNGDQDVNKELMMWGGACIFLIVAPLIIEAFFG